MGLFPAYDLAIAHFEHAVAAALLVKITFELIPTAKELSAGAAINRSVALDVFRDFQIDCTASFAVQFVV
jgi:hypothetical protein